MDVAVVLTDTKSRAWGLGQTDAVIGSAGLAVLRGMGGADDGSVAAELVRRAGEDLFRLERTTTRTPGGGQPRRWR